MIKVILRGGLGNQMFQYALGSVLAEKNNTSLVLDTTILNDRFPRKETTFRDYDLDVFNINPRFTNLSQISTSFPIPGFWAILDITSDIIKDILGVQKKIKEEHDFEFDPNTLQAGENITLVGYWQTEKYFADQKEKIRNEFQFINPLTGEAKEIAEQIASSNSISLHVRRGDYISHTSVVNTLGPMGVPYYEKAVDHIARQVKDPHFFIFSNDIEWCRENIKLQFPTTYLTDASAGPKSAFHLELMSLCKHNIIANSTYSWWGAWLNRNPQKIVVAPKEWRIQGSRGLDDIVPSNWIKI